MRVAPRRLAFEGLSSLAGERLFCTYHRKKGKQAMPAQTKNGAVPRKKRLLTGLRPTGKFHLGNYVGTFEKDLELQNSGEYECFFLIADYHVLTTGDETAGLIVADIREGVLDVPPVGV